MKLGVNGSVLLQGLLCSYCQKVARVGVISKVFSLARLVLELGRLEQLGLLGHFYSLSPGVTVPWGTCRRCWDFSNAALDTTTSTAFCSSGQLQRPTKLQGKGPVLHLLMGGGSKDLQLCFKTIMYPLMLFFPQPLSLLLPMQPISPVSFVFFFHKEHLIN